MLLDGVPVLALIPARGGSKGVPRKNLALLSGKPLIFYTVNAAKKAKYVDAIWVSSEDEEILRVSSNLGAQPLLRPYEFAGDNASPVAVVSHFIDSLPEQLRKQNAVIVYLQPTSPLRNHIHIDNALQAMEVIGVDAVMSVVEADKPPQKAFMLNESGCLMSLFDERISNLRRQDLPQCYYPNGAIYIFRVNTFLSRQGFPSNGSFPFIMSKSDSIDIDTDADLMRAAVALGEKNGGI